MDLINRYFYNILQAIKPLIKKCITLILILLGKIYGNANILRHTHNVLSAVEAIKANKLKSILTALGIIFGVAAVISMLAIGNGAKREILEQMKYIGVNNIIINSIDPNSVVKENNTTENKFYKGLTIRDIESIQEVLSSVKFITPEILYNTNVIHENFRKPVKLIGISNSYFEVYSLKVEHGKLFNSYQENYGLPVCLISSELKRKLFKKTDPLNQYIKCGSVWLKIIGIYEKRNSNASIKENIKVDFDDNNIYVPVKTMLFRYINRSLLKPVNMNNFVGMGTTKENGIKRQQLDKIIVQVKESKQMIPTAEILNRMLLRRHFNIKDFEIIVPELLLKQQQRAKEIFNFVLGAIAAISLIVGGIGIMNIMYASVLERTKEIGTRMAVGATRNDIGVQFIAESILISFTGGIAGVFLGVIISKMIMLIAGIYTIVSFFSIIIAFFISVTIGITFGYAPAREAALKNPIETLRYE